MKFTVERHALVDSTNILCKQRAAEGAREGLVVVADRQSAGQGRMGKSFFSPGLTGLYMTLLLRPTLAPEESLRLTALAAVAVCRAVKSLGDFDPRIKWVNDVYLNHKKLCGILTQSGLCPGGRGLDWAVVGIGVNLVEPEGGFPEEIREIAAALYASHPDPLALRERLMERILSEFAVLYENPMDPAATEEYRRLCFLAGKSVLVHTAGSIYPAKVLGVNDDLTLYVEREDNHERLKLSSGEVSLKLR